jgi:hypothetical protein
MQGNETETTVEERIAARFQYDVEDGSRVIRSKLSYQMELFSCRDLARFFERTVPIN